MKYATYSKNDNFFDFYCYLKMKWTRLLCHMAILVVWAVSSANEIERCLDHISLFFPANAYKFGCRCKCWQLKWVVRAACIEFMYIGRVTPTKNWGVMVPMLLCGAVIILVVTSFPFPAPCFHVIVLKDATTRCCGWHQVIFIHISTRYYYVRRTISYCRVVDHDISSGWKSISYILVTDSMNAYVCHKWNWLCNLHTTWWHCQIRLTDTGNLGTAFQ